QRPFVCLVVLRWSTLVAAAGRAGFFRLFRGPLHIGTECLNSSVSNPCTGARECRPSARFVPAIGSARCRCGSSYQAEAWRSAAILFDYGEAGHPDLQFEHPLIPRRTTMSKTTQPIPAGQENLIPHLVCSPCSQAIEFYKKAFGAEEISRAPAPDGKRIM